MSSEPSPSAAVTATGENRPAFARLGDRNLLLPVAARDATIIAYQPVSDERAVQFSPIGDQANSNALVRFFRGIFAGQPSVRYYLLPGEGSGATGSILVGAAPGSSGDGAGVGHGDRREAVQALRQVRRRADGHPPGGDERRHPLHALHRRSGGLHRRSGDRRQDPARQGPRVPRGAGQATLGATPTTPVRTCSCRPRRSPSAERAVLLQVRRPDRGADGGGPAP